MTDAATPLSGLRAALRRRIGPPSLTSAAAISFSLTFVGASVALLTGALSPSITAMPLPVDVGVLLLMVPLCALVLAMLVEVLRAALGGAPPHRSAPRRDALARHATMTRRSHQLWR